MVIGDKLKELRETMLLSKIALRISPSIDSVFRSHPLC